MFLVVYPKNVKKLKGDVEMNLRTTATLEKLRGVDWFRSVGHHDQNAEHTELVSSWYEAVESSSSPEWEDLCLEAVNQLCARLVERSPERFNKWNDIVLEVKPIAKALVREKTRQVIEENGLPKEFLDQVNWDIVHLCMEAEYADIFPPAFYASLSYWYVNGHFPCGWKGNFPNGNLIIY